MTHRVIAAIMSATFSVLALLTAIGALAGGHIVAAQVIPTPTPGAGVAVNSAGPTATAGQTGNVLPSGTLILEQRNQAIALLPNGAPLSLKAEQFGPQATANGTLGVRFDTANGLVNLTLVDNRNGQTKAIPQGTGFTSPTVTWKKDGSGFAFFDFPPPSKTGPNVGAILYYNVQTNATSVLIKAPAAGQLATATAWSPDGRYLVYEVSKAGAEGTGGPDTKAFLFDSATGGSSPLAADAAGFVFWDRAAQGFMTQRSDLANNASQLVYYPLRTMDKPIVLTPANTLDLLVDQSPDGKQIVVSASPGGKNAPVANLYLQSLAGGNRQPITSFKASDQTITGLVWGTDGIYYSLSSANGTNGGDTTWRIDPDGKNARQVAVGTLIAIVGAH
ncbi:MAG: TolB family protein [Aggregatilineales bacterium]